MGSNETGSNSRPLTADERTAVYNAAQEKLGAYLPAGGYSSPEYTAPGATQRASYTSPGEASDASFTAASPTRGAEYTDPGEARTLSGGDYNRLEQAVLASRLAPLDQAWQRRREEINQEMADRGLYVSGIGPQSENKIFARDFLPAYQQAGAEAATQRYGLESGELGNLNQYSLSRAGQGNTFNLGNTQMLNEGELARANAANTFEQTDASRRDQFAHNAAQGANAFETSRFGAEEQAALGRAAAANAFAADQAEKQYQSKWRPADYWQGAWNGTGGVVSSSSGGGWSI